MALWGASFCGGGVRHACCSCLLLGDLLVVPTAERGQQVGGGGFTRGVLDEVVGLKVDHLGASLTVPPYRGALVPVTVEYLAAYSVGDVLVGVGPGHQMSK